MHAVLQSRSHNYSHVGPKDASGFEYRYCSHGGGSEIVLALKRDYPTGRLRYHGWP